MKEDDIRFRAVKRHDAAQPIIDLDAWHMCVDVIIERTRKQGEITIWRDWITFDTVEEAADYFNECCSAFEYVGS